MWQTRIKRCIYTSPSGYKVYQNYYYRWLTLGNDALQTVIRRNHPERPILFYIPSLTLMARHIPGDCCLLGLGGAGVAHMLSTEANYSKITAVDNSEEIIDIAQRFFMVDRIPNLTIIQQNATDYMQHCSEHYPHILIDLANATHFPPECAHDSFFKHCRERLMPSGFLAINLPNSTEHWPILQLIKKQFKNTLIFIINRCANMVVIASPLEDRTHFLSQIENTHELKNISWVVEWGFVSELKK